MSVKISKRTRYLSIIQQQRLSVGPLPQENSPMLVCCGGKFYSVRKSNFPREFRWELRLGWMKVIQSSSHHNGLLKISMRILFSALTAVDKDKIAVSTITTTPRGLEIMQDCLVYCFRIWFLGNSVSGAKSSDSHSSPHQLQPAESLILIQLWFWFDAAQV